MHRPDKATTREVIYQDDLKEHLLVHLHKLLIPLPNVRRLLARVGLIVRHGHRVVLVMVAPHDHFAQDRLIDLIRAGVCSSAAPTPDALQVGRGDGNVHWESG